MAKKRIVVWFLVCLLVAYPKLAAFTSNLFCSASTFSVQRRCFFPVCMFDVCVLQRVDAHVCAYSSFESVCFFLFALFFFCFLSFKVWLTPITDGMSRVRRWKTVKQQKKKNVNGLLFISPPPFFLCFLMHSGSTSS